MNLKNKKIVIIALSLVLFLVAGVFISLFGKQDFEKVKDKINNSTQTESNVNVNLLKNSDFSINNSGLNIFDQESDSTIFLDDWVLRGVADMEYTIYQVSDGLLIQTGESSTIGLWQNIDGVNSFINREITLSFSCDGIVYSKTDTLSDTKTFMKIFQPSLQAVVELKISQDYVAVGFNVLEGFNSTLNWIKLEFGNVFTGYIAE